MHSTAPQIDSVFPEDGVAIMIPIVRVEKMRLIVVRNVNSPCSNFLHNNTIQ